jgi:membrane associated rhomboid family serine protease
MGTLVQIAANPDSLVPTLGASGAIAGIMGAYVVWFPHNRVRVLVFRFITVMPALLVIGLWIVMQVWLGLGSIGQLGEVGGVAYLAHVGGAATGIFVALLFHDRARQLEARNDYRDGWIVGP